MPCLAEKIDFLCSHSPLSGAGTARVIEQKTTCRILRICVWRQPERFPAQPYAYEKAGSHKIKLSAEVIKRNHPKPFP